MREFVCVLAGALLFAALATPSFARDGKARVVNEGKPAEAKEVWDRQPPHGRDLMTRSERREFWHQFLALQTDDERRDFWLAHNAKMDQRALEWGVSLEPARDIPPGYVNVGFYRPPYFSDIMTEDEIAHYRSDLDALPDREDRRRYVREHIVKMQVRAAERGVSIPSALEFDDVFDGITADQAGAAAIRAALGYEGGVVPTDAYEAQGDDDSPGFGALDDGTDDSQAAEDGDSLGADDGTGATGS